MLPSEIPVRVFLVEPRATVREGLGLLLERDGRVEIVVGDRNDRAAPTVLAVLLCARGPAGAVLWGIAAPGVVGSVQRVWFARRLIRNAELRPYLRK